MEKYIVSTLTTNCPHCSKLLFLPVEVCWDQFKPEKYRCPHCKGRLSLTATGKIEKAEK